MKRILVVDDNKVNLAMAKAVLSEQYEVVPVMSGIQALKYLESNTADLILLDMFMPEMDGYETLCRIKKDEKLRHISVVILTADTTSETEVKCLRGGATDFIKKPFVPEIMLSRINRILELEEYRKGLEKIVKKKTEQIEKLQHNIIMGIATMIDKRDVDTGRHAYRTSIYMQVLVRALRDQGYYTDILTNKYINHLCRSAPLHDVGKIGVPDSILCKPGKLTPEEYQCIKNHTVIGKNIISECMKGLDGDNFLHVAKDMVYYHHERWDGKGYPEGKKGEEIPLCARIMAVADVFDAIFSKRVYKEGMSFEEAFKVIEDGKGVYFDPLIAEVFLSQKEVIKNVAVKASEGNGDI